MIVRQWSLHCSWAFYNLVTWPSGSSTAPTRSQGKVGRVALQWIVRYLGAIANISSPFITPVAMSTAMTCTNNFNYVYVLYSLTTKAAKYGFGNHDWRGFMACHSDI